MIEPFSLPPNGKFSLGRKVILLALRTATIFFRIFRQVWRAFTYLWKLFLRPVVSRAQRVAWCWMIIPLYKRLRGAFKIIRHIFGPARYRLVGMLANRYTGHVVLILVILFTVTHNLYAKEIRTDAYGRNSLLFHLIKNEEIYDEEEVIVEEAEEQAGNISADVKPLKYNDYIGAVSALPSANGSQQQDIFEQATVVQGGSAIVKPVNVAEIAGHGDQPKRNTAETYIVQEGDTLSVIALDFGVSVDTILWENGLSARSIIRPGDTLRILPVSGVSYTVRSGDTLLGIAHTYDVPVQDIMEFNNFDGASTLVIGKNIILPGAEPVSSRLARPQTPVSSSRLGFITDIFRKAPSVPAGENLLWPVPGRRITQYFRGWRHTGVDIAGLNETDDIYAARGGVVTVAGWNSGGYGYRVIVDHGGGMLTLYAHMSKIFVQIGQRVEKGRVLGKVGSTGRSTGPHLHFEILIGGTRVNPLSYY